MAITTVVNSMAEEGPVAENDNGVRSVDANFTVLFLANSIAWTMSSSSSVASRKAIQLVVVTWPAASRGRHTVSCKDPSEKTNRPLLRKGN